MIRFCWGYKALANKDKYRYSADDKLFETSLADDFLTGLIGLWLWRRGNRNKQKLPLF